MSLPHSLSWNVEYGVSLPSAARETTHRPLHCSVHRGRVGAELLEGGKLTKKLGVRLELCMSPGSYRLDRYVIDPSGKVLHDNILRISYVKQS